MIRYTKLLKSIILDNNEGEEFGKVVDLVFSNDLHKITNLIVESGKLIKDKWLIPFTAIISMDDDRVLVSKDKCFNLEELSLEKLIMGENINIIEKSVLKEDGELIGYVKDVMINPLNGILIGFIMTEGIFEEIFNGRSFIPNTESIRIGGENIVIDDMIMDQIVKNKDYYKKLLELEDG